MKRKLELPLRNPVIAAEIKEAFEFAEQGESHEDAMENVTSGLDSDSPFLRLVAMAMLQATLELCLCTHMDRFAKDRESIATRYLSLLKWTITRYGTDGCELIVRICMTGQLLEELSPRGVFLIELSDGDSTTFKLSTAFTNSIRTARAIKAGTYTPH